MITHIFTPSRVLPKRHITLVERERAIVMALGDVHYGSEGWPERLFREQIGRMTESGAHFLGLGEMFDFTSASQRAILRSMRESQREILDQQCQESVERLGEILKPTAGKWLGLCEGDHYHEYVDGTTSDQRLCRILRAPFLGTSSIVPMRLKQSGRDHSGCDVPIYAHHGFGGGRLVGSGLNAVEKLSDVIESDVYLMGHNHARVVAVADRLYCSPGGHLYHRRKIFARTGSFFVGYHAKPPQPLHLRAELSRGSYVERRALRPSALGGIAFSMGIRRERDRATGTDLCLPDLAVIV